MSFGLDVVIKTEILTFNMNVEAVTQTQNVTELETLQCNVICTRCLRNPQPTVSVVCGHVVSSQSDRIMYGYVILQAQWQVIQQERPIQFGKCVLPRLLCPCIFPFWMSSKMRKRRTYLPPCLHEWISPNFFIPHLLFSFCFCLSLSLALSLCPSISSEVYHNHITSVWWSTLKAYYVSHTHTHIQEWDPLKAYYMSNIASNTGDYPLGQYAWAEGKICR